MNFRHNPAIKIISAFVLFFFTWSFGGVFDIAYAVKESDKLQGVSAKAKNSRQPKTHRAEEKFQKAVEDIDQALTDTTLDTEKKKSRFRAKRSEIESFDTDIKKQFADTEKKLKDDGMPSEILERHRKFVKQYEDNLKELKDNLNALDKAKTKAAFDTESDKAKRFLEKVKAPKAHKAFDPNHMPHRTAEPVFKEPRMKSDEFEKEQKQKSVAQIQKPILVASTGSLDGLLSSTSSTTSDQQPILLAQASNPPTSDDLTETIEVQFTPEIRAKAQELGYNPVKIYNWVRNNIEYVPTYGSIQGPIYACRQNSATISIPQAFWQHCSGPQTYLPNMPIELLKYL